MKHPRLIITNNSLDIYEEDPNSWTSLNIKNMANGHYSVIKTSTSIEVIHKSIKNKDLLECKDLATDLSVEKGSLNFKSNLSSCLIEIQAKPDLIADSMNTMIFTKDKKIYSIIIELN